MRLLVITAAIMFVSFSLSGCIGSGSVSNVQSNGEDIFPELTGIDLHGKERLIPGSLEGEFNIVVLGFEREHQTPINTWIPIAGEIMKSNNEIKFYEVPLIYEVNAAYRTWINNGMRAGITGDIARERTITVYTDREKFTSLMGMETNDIYTLLINKEGHILWKEKGEATEKGINSLKLAVKGL